MWPVTTHRTGALPEPERTPNGYRDYTVDDVARLIRLTTLTGAGIPTATVGLVTDNRDLLKDALLAVDSHVEELHRQPSRILSLLTGPRSIPPDTTDLLDNLRQWTMGREPEDHTVVALLDRGIRALQLMVDTGMTTVETWEVLRKALTDEDSLRATVSGYVAWQELGILPAEDPGVPALVEKCRRGLTEGILAALTDTLIPGDLPLTTEDVATDGARTPALAQLVGEFQT
jgi:DNA-binding transcriptional MerR regulator